MSYNGSGTFVINSTGQPVVTGTVISSSTFNAFTADIGTGLSTAITKNGQTTTTALIPFAFGISAAVSSSFAAGTVAAPSIYLATDTGTGFYRIGANNNGYSVSGTKLLDFSSALLAITGAATVSTTLGVTGATTLSSALTYGGVTLSNAVTGTGNMVLSASPTVTGTLSAAAITASGVVSTTARSMLVQPTTATNDGSYKVTNTGGTLFVGLDDSAAGAFGTAGNYGTVIYRPNGTGLAISRTSTVDLAISSAGVVNIPGGLNNTVLGATTPAAASVTTLTANVSGTNPIVLTRASDATTYGILSFNNVFTSTGMIGFAGGGGVDSNLYLNTPTGGAVVSRVNAVAITTTSSTGLSITGTLSSTGTISATGSGSNVEITRAAAVGQHFQIGDGTRTARLAIAGDNSIYVGTTTAHDFYITYNGAIKATAKSTGFDVTGSTIITGAAASYALQALGNATAGQAAYFDQKNTTATTSAVDVQHEATTGDNIFIKFFTEASPTQRGSISYNRAGGLTVYNTTSDYRSKDITGKYEASGETIDQLQVYLGKMKGATIARPMMIAHEAASVVPYAVTGEKDAVDEKGDPIYQSMDHQIFVPLLIAEVQSLRSRVALLEAK